MWHTKVVRNQDIIIIVRLVDHVESATAIYPFHKVKFGLQKTFCVVFEIPTS